MEEKNGSSERQATTYKTHGGGDPVVHLQTEEDRDTEERDAPCHREYPEDETDRQIRAMGEWFSAKLRDAKLIDVVGIVTGIALVVVGIIAAWIYDGQLQEMRKATQATTETMQVSQRPWVSLDVQANSDISYNEAGLYMFDLFTLNNFGSTPAVNARLDVEIVGDGVDEAIKKSCSSVEVHPDQTKYAALREAYFAGVPTYKSWVLTFDPVKQGHSREHNGTFEPILIACVAYQSSFDPTTWHHTWKAFLILKRDPTSPNGVYVMEDGKPVKKSDVVFAPWTHPEGED